MTYVHQVRFLQGTCGHVWVCSICRRTQGFSVEGLGPKNPEVQTG